MKYWTSLHGFSTILKSIQYKHAKVYIIFLTARNGSQNTVKKYVYIYIYVYILVETRAATDPPSK